MCSMSARLMARNCPRSESCRATQAKIATVSAASRMRWEFPSNTHPISRPRAAPRAAGASRCCPGQSAAEEFSTLSHELAHELLHRGDRRATTNKRIHETEAEATAYVVCQAVGLDTGSAASDYIQIWNGDVEVLTESLGYIRQAASQMLEALT